MTVEVCKCNGQEIFNSQDPQTRKHPSTFPKDDHDEDGYHLCPWCGKYRFPRELAQCDICDKYFKGYRKYPKIRYTCPDCEANL